MGYILGSSLCLYAFHFYAGETYSLKTFFSTLVKKVFNSEFIQYLYGIIFHILIYLEFILTYGVRNGSIFMYFYMVTPCHYFKNYLYPSDLSYYFYYIVNLLISLSLLLGFCSVLLVYLSSYAPVQQCSITETLQYVLMSVSFFSVFF